MRLLPLLPLILLVACSRQEPPAPETAQAPAPLVEAPATPEPAAAAPAGQVPRAFLCRGNEPFWSLDISADSALLKTPDAETALSGELKASDSGALTFRGAPPDSPAESVAAVLSPAQCFDSMADGPARPFSAVVSFADGRQGSGCCSAEYGLDLDAAPAFDGAGKPAQDWSRLLPGLSAAISRCALDAGVATDAVTQAWLLEQGKAGVRLRDTGNDRFDCVIDLETGEIEDVAAVGAADRRPGEGMPLWLPARENPPVLDCGRVERVLDVGDVLAGYLHYPEGCR